MSAAVIELDPPMTEVPAGGGTVEELAEEMVGLAARLAVMMCRWLLLVARFDELDGAAAYGLPCTSRWLAHACGLAHRTAIEHVRVARALAAFPALARAMGSGALSYSQVRAISRVPREGEHEVVADLIEFALHASAAQLETVVRGMRTAADGDDPPPDPASDDDELDPAPSRAESVSSRWTAESTWRLDARLDPERGAAVDAVLDSIVAAEGISRPDALVRLAEIGLAAVAATPGALPGVRGDERAAVVVHLHLAEPDAVPTAGREATRAPATAATATAATATAATAGTAPPTTAAAVRTAAFWRGAHLEHGPGVPRNVVERLLCQGRVRTVAHGPEGSVLDVGRSRRVVTDKQFRALVIEHDGTCAFPGCVRRERLEAHHIRHWLHGGRTDMANLTLLCPTHHHAHHDNVFDIRGRRGGRRFVRADGLDLAAVAELRPGAPLVQEIGAGTGPAPAGSADPLSLAGGDRLDRRWVISVLAGRREQHRDVS